MNDVLVFLETYVGKLGDQ